MRSLSAILLTTLLMLSSCGGVTERKEGFEVHGIDVSRYQSDIDWTKVAEQDISFAFVKASEGETISDQFFCKNWDEMKEAGIRRGAYHFFRPKTSVLTQAQKFLDNVILEEGDLPPVLDVEVMDNVSEIALISRMRTWLEIVEFELQIRPIIYTNLKFYNKYLADHFPEYPVWIARYNDYFEPMLTNGLDWSFWQYGNKGRLEGIEGFVDFNVFKGTERDLAKMCFSLEPSISVDFFE